MIPPHKKGRKPALSQEDVREIRRKKSDPDFRYPNGTKASTGKLAREYRVSTATISAVLDRKGAYAE